ncbi:NADPH:quinone oxidoreductase family protein [Limibacillus sp. MBR-115]|uniref:NADPH:quinone oxidoreductase family protein n=1 Tax=Limibacillus sp. MBR-115 TaxID=3156465 RepID=UPI003392F10E
MKAYELTEYGPPSSHSLGEVARPEVVAGEVLIRVEAIGLNYPDALMVQGKYQKRPNPPFVPGRDCAGTVVAVGDGVDSVAPGDAVVAQVFSGAFAEFVAAPLERVFKRPDGVSSVEGAGAITVFNTAYVAVVIRANVRAGERVVVTGAAGGVGAAAVQLAKARGAEVVGVVSTDAKAERVRALGADHVVIVSDATEDGLKKLFKTEVRGLWPDGRGVNVVVDTVGGHMFTAGLRGLGFAGRMIVVGFASGDIPAAKTNYLLYNNLSVMGAPLDIHFAEALSEIREGADWWLSLMASGHCKANVEKTVPFDELMDGLQALLDRTAIGKTVVTLDTSAT